MKLEADLVPEIHWFVPTAGDGRHLGAPTRPAGFAYLTAVAQAADTLGFDGVLLPTGGLSEDTIVVASALSSLTLTLRFLVAVRPGLISPILAARITASLDRISNGRASINVVSGSGKADFEGLPLSHQERYELTREWLAAYRGAFGSQAVNLKGKHIQIENGKALLPSVQRPYPPVYFGGSSDEARSVAAEFADVYLTWGERPEEVAEKIADVRRQAKLHGRQVRFGLRAHLIVRPTEDEAWRAADRLIEHLTDQQIAGADRICGVRVDRAATHGQPAPRQSRQSADRPQSLGRCGPGAWRGRHRVCRQSREYRAGAIRIPRRRDRDVYPVRIPAPRRGVPHGRIAVPGDWQIKSWVSDRGERGNVGDTPCRSAHRRAFQFDLIQFLRQPVLAT